jgi:glutathione S-transferase
MAEPHKLYGMEVSLYTGKIRAYLRYKGIPFEEILATRDLYMSTILPRVGWPVVPVMITSEDETLQDTSDMIDHFEARYPDPPIIPQTPKQKLAALLLETYGDEWLVLPAMHYRWNYNEAWIIEEFGRNSKPEATLEEWRVIGDKAATQFRGSVPILGINDATIPAIEKSYEALLDELSAHFEVHPYLLGSRPSIGDYGLIGPLYAHLYRDPESGALMKRLAPNVAKWVERVEYAPEPKSGAFLPDDEIPETLLPILQRMMREQMPVLQSTVAAYAKWAARNDDKEVPRAIGMHGFTIEGVTGERPIFTFNQWMLQRPYDHYKSLAGADKAAADDLLQSVGGELFRDLTIERRVKREKFKLVRAD